MSLALFRLFRKHTWTKSHCHFTFQNKKVVDKETRNMQWTHNLQCINLLIYTRFRLSTICITLQPFKSYLKTLQGKIYWDNKPLDWLPWCSIKRNKNIILNWHTIHMMKYIKVMDDPNQIIITPHHNLYTFSFINMYNIWVNSYMSYRFKWTKEHPIINPP